MTGAHPNWLEHEDTPIELIEFYIQQNSNQLKNMHLTYTNYVSPNFFSVNSDDRMYTVQAEVDMNSL